MTNFFLVSTLEFIPHTINLMLFTRGDNYRLLPTFFPLQILLKPSLDQLLALRGCVHGRPLRVFGCINGGLAHRGVLLEFTVQVVSSAVLLASLVVLQRCLLQLSQLLVQHLLLFLFLAYKRGTGCFVRHSVFQCGIIQFFRVFVSCSSPCGWSFGDFLAWIGVFGATWSFGWKLSCVEVIYRVMISGIQW